MRENLYGSFGNSEDECVPETYAITYVSNGGTEYETDYYTIESETITLPTPTRQHYSFGGWYDNEDFDGQPITTVNPGVNSDHENKTFYAQWSPQEIFYDFYCDANWAIHIMGGETEEIYGITFPDASSCPQVDAYNLTGWICVNDNDSEDTVEFRNVENAEWTADFHEFDCYPKWVEKSTFVPDWNCVDGIIEDDADDWTTETKEDLTSSHDLYDQGVVSFTYGDSYVISSETPEKAKEHLRTYLEGEEFYVTWGNTTIRGWAGCGPNTWNSRSDYSYTLQTMTYTNAGCGCSLDKENWAVKRRLLTVNGSNWFEKNEYCRANCPAACANAVATDSRFRELLFNGVCPEPYRTFDCDNGEYLNINSADPFCDVCPTGYYCPAGTWDMDNAAESLNVCPSLYPYSQEGSSEQYDCYANITYVFNDDSEDITNRITYDDEAANEYSLDLSQQPTRNYYTFDGWYTDDEFTGNPITNEDTFNVSDLTLYAKWTLDMFVCESGIWLHIGDNTRACLSTTKLTSPALAVQIGNDKYYLQITEDTNKHINEGSDAKMHIYYNGREYNIHDASVTRY